MKKLRNFYLIGGLAALAFALLTKHIPGITITDFVYGFCYGLSITLFIAGIITASTPLFCRKKGNTPTGSNLPDGTPGDSSSDSHPSSEGL